jgi:hypothetical protein
MTSEMVAPEQPDAEMMAVVGRIAHFIETRDETLLQGLFVDQNVSIVENFPPYLFEGLGAVNAWAAQMKAHVENLSELRHTFGLAYDFSHMGDEVYFSLPTTWEGLARGKPFREIGGWAIVLTRQAEAWRVLAYGWAVIESTHS